MFSHLQRQACHFLEIKNVFLHARIPVIKAEATLLLPTSLSHVYNTSNDVTSVKENRMVTSTAVTYFKLSIDISLDGPTHSGTI